MKAEEYILNNSFVVYYPAAKCTRVVIDYKALQALNMARKEEREKAIKAFRKVTCRTGIDIPCEYCSNVCKINEFVKRLNE